MSDATTVPPADPTADPAGGGKQLFLVVAWCAGLEHRVGESAGFADLGIVRILGRGAASRGEVPVEFSPWHPVDRRRPTELDVDTLSRRLLEVTATAVGLEVKLLGRGPMRISGKLATHGFAAPGDTILIENRLLLYVTLRPATSTLRSFPLSHLGPPGQPDRFGMVGDSERMMRARDEAARAASSDQHVLVLGETGSGKEALARTVHFLSDRASKPFVAHNGAALSPELAPAEIFGNEKDFPNPPMEARPGLVGESDGGTLYLDEIGELPEKVQTDLLRVLDQGGEYRRLGGKKTLRADVHMIGATNQPLSRPRADFVGRFTVRVPAPALSERVDDIPLLLQHRAKLLLGQSKVTADRERFIEERPDGARYVRIAPDLVEALMRADHPHNVRGLDATLLAAIGQSVGNTIRASKEQLEALRPAPKHNPRAFRMADGRLRDLTPDEVNGLRRRIDGTYGCVGRAAAAMDVSRHQLRRALARYGIAEPPPEDGDDDR